MPVSLYRLSMNIMTIIERKGHKIGDSDIMRSNAIGHMNCQTGYVQTGDVQTGEQLETHSSLSL